MLGTAGEVKTNSLATFSNGLLHMETPVLANEQRLTHTSSMRTADAVN